jgi:hypothetical protein
MLSRAFIVIGLGALALSGCGQSFDPFSKSTANAPAPAVKSRPQRAPVKPDATVAANTSPANPSRSCSSDGSEKVPDLVGLDQSQLQQMLGKPNAVATKAPGKTWSYRNRCCELSVALYPNLQTQSYQVLSYEVISDDSSDRAKRACLADISHYDTARSTTESGK